MTAGGRLALTSWNDPARARLVGVLLEAVHEVGIAPPETVPNVFRFADDTELESLLKDQNFVVFEPSSPAQRRMRRRATGRTAARHRPDVRGHSRPAGRRRASHPASFDRRVDGYRIGETYQLPVSFRLARARRG